MSKGQIISTFAIALSLFSNQVKASDQCDPRDGVNSHRIHWQDDFKAEFAANSSLFHPWIPLNFTGLQKWNVVQGKVDYIPVVNGFAYWFSDLSYFKFFDLDNPFVDLDGTANQSARIRSKSPVDLGPGRYTLVVELAGNYRVPTSDQVTFSFGNLATKSVVLAPTDDFQFHYASFIVPPRSSNMFIEIANDGGAMNDNQGPLLRHVAIVRGNLDHCE